MTGYIKRPLFQWVVAIPNALSLVYLGLLASPVYESDAQLLVKSSRKQEAGIERMLAGGSSSDSQEGAYILKEYVQSWQSYNSMKEKENIEKIFSSGDFVARYGGVVSLFRRNDVALWNYFQNMAMAEVDEKSGIVRLSVRAFSPEDAHRLSTTLLANAVRNMDQMNAAQERDAVSVAAARKRQMELALAEDEAALAAYRSKEGIFDPSAHYTADLELASGLALQESQLIAQQSAGQLTMAANPNVEALAASISSIQNRMRKAEQSAPVLARKAAKYNELVTKRENDVALLKSASMAVQEAQLKAIDGRYYLSVISAPSAPRSPQLPHRIQWIFVTLIISLLLWGLLR